jgi:membrane protein DedA with SNARE-associated domain
VLAALIHITQNLGYPVLFLLVMAESSGIPVPGETALILGGLAANQGHLSIVLVIVLAATAAIIGDNFGFMIGRRGGRALLEKPGRFAGQRRRVLEIGDPFFEKHGNKAVFFGRWIAGLRVWAAVLAGTSEMRWRNFLVFNAAGGIAWATTVGLAAYFGGKAVERVVAAAGLYGGIAVGVVLLALLILHRRRSHRGDATAEPHGPSGGTSD